MCPLKNLIPQSEVLEGLAVLGLVLVRDGGAYAYACASSFFSLRMVLVLVQSRAHLLVPMLVVQSLVLVQEPVL